MGAVSLTGGGVGTGARVGSVSQTGLQRAGSGGGLRRVCFTGRGGSSCQGSVMIFILAVMSSRCLRTSRATSRGGSLAGEGGEPPRRATSKSPRCWRSSRLSRLTPPLPGPLAGVGMGASGFGCFLVSSALRTGSRRDRWPRLNVAFGVRGRRAGSLTPFHMAGGGPVTAVSSVHCSAP